MKSQRKRLLIFFRERGIQFKLIEDRVKTNIFKQKFSLYNENGNVYVCAFVCV